MEPYIFYNAICLFLLTTELCAVVFQRHFTIGAGEAFWAHANVLSPTFLICATVPTGL